ncbi:MAG: endoribonuclease YicC domain-containing protein, partial [Oceanicaulis sp.]
GAALAGMLEDHVAEIEALREEAAASAAVLPQAIRDRVKAKFDELLPEGLDADRLAQEAAAIAVKADVREELDRLKAHIDTARSLIAGGSPCGRKLDFLSQEFNREANTLCSKAADPALTRAGLAMKAAVDRLREQVQNVE